MWEEYELTPEQEKNCTNHYHTGHVRSIKTDKCIITYKTINCEPSEANRFDNDTRSTDVQFNSFHVCSQELGGGPLLDVDFHRNIFQNGTVLKYRNVCGCKTIPTGEREWVDQGILMMNNYGNGIAVYENEKCEHPYFYFGPGEIWLEDKTQKFPLGVINMRSFAPMKTTNCVR